MRALIIAAGTSPASVFAVAPLASALRNAGHEILVAGFDELTPSIESVGLPPVALPTEHDTDSIKDLTDRPGGRLEFPPRPEDEVHYCGAWFARQAAVTFDGAVELARSWGADLVVGGTLAHVAALVSARLGLPYVRQTWDWVDFREARGPATLELAPELETLGLDRIPREDLLLDMCPPSLRPPDAEDAQLMRWVPGNRQGKLEPWMYRRPDRRRVCITLGSFRTSQAAMSEFLTTVVDRVRRLDVEVVVAAPESTALPLRERFPDVRAGWIPLEFLLPTCDAIVHHSGGLTALGAMSAGVPQLTVTQFSLYDSSLERLEKHGSGLVLHAGEDTAENVAAETSRLVENESFRDRANELSEEMAALTPPGGVVASVERLVA